MRPLRFLYKAAVTLACLGMVIPQSVFAAEPGRASVASRTTQAKLVTDVALQHNGVLIGQVVDQKSQPVATSVSIRSGYRTIATTKTGKSGLFKVTGLRGGVYTITAGQNIQNVRVWTQHTAPPVAKKSFRMVAKPMVIRGQDPEVLYDQGGNAYGRVRVMADPPAPMQGEVIQGGVVDNGGGIGYVEGGGFLGGLDLVTTTILAASLAGVTIAAINLSDIDDLEDRVDRIPVSP